MRHLNCDLTNVDIQFLQDDYVAGLERRLRMCITQHKKLLLGMTTDEETSRQAVVSQILERVRELDSADYSFGELPQMTSSSGGRFITIASVNVPVDDVHALLRSILEEDGRAETFARSILDDTSPEEKLTGSRCSDKQFVSNTHVTLAHCRSFSQSEMRKKFGQAEGSFVSVRPVALLWNDVVAALEVVLEGDNPVESTNAFVHVTVWAKEGTSAKSANDLPQQVEQGEASRLDISCAELLSGKVSLWK